MPAWVPDDSLDDEQRAAVAQFVRPRWGLDGRLYWPLDEMEAADEDGVEAGPSHPAALAASGVAAASVRATDGHVLWRVVCQRSAP